MKNKLRLGLSILLLSLIAAFISPYIADAAGHIGRDNLITYLRTARVGPLRLYANNNAANTTDTVAGTGGVLAIPTLNAVTSIDLTTFSRALYPCAVEIVAKDGGNDSTLTCTGDWTVYGRNQFGVSISETGSSDIVETTPITTSRAFEQVTRFTTSGCSGANAANDIVRLACSNKIGFDVPIKTAGAVLEVCAFATSESAAGNMTCYTGAQLTTSINTQYHTIDFAGMAALTPASTIVDDTQVYMRLRPPAGE